MNSKIHFFDQYGFIGGGQTVLLESIQAALDEDFQVELHAPDGPLFTEINKRFDNKVQSTHISIPAVSHGKKSILELIKIVLFNLAIFFRSIRDTKGHLVYVNGGRLFLLAALSAFFRTSHVYIHLHIAPTKIELLLFKKIIKLNFFHAIIVNSPFIKDMVAQSLGNSDKLKLVENELPRKFSEVEFRPPENQNGIISTTPGVIRPEKGQDIIIKISKSLPDVQFNIVGRVGEGAEKWFDNLKKTAPPNVYFHSATDEIINFFSQTKSNVCLIPSKWDEPFGLVAIEGMACSCVTIVSNRGGLRSISERTGAILFKEPEELIGIFHYLQKMSPQSFHDLARAQYISTQSIFGGLTYGRRLMNVIRQDLKE